MHRYYAFGPAALQYNEGTVQFVDGPCSVHPLLVWMVFPHHDAPLPLMHPLTPYLPHRHQG